MVAAVSTITYQWRGRVGSEITYWVAAWGWFEICVRNRFVGIVPGGDRQPGQRRKRLEPVFFMIEARWFQPSAG